MGTDSKDPAATFNLFSLQGLGQVRLGHGLIGKMCLAVVVAIGALGSIAIAIGGPNAHWFQITIAVFILLIIGSFGTAAFWYGVKYPQVVLLEGGELIQWRQMDMAAKGATEVLPTQNVEPPKAVTEPPVKET